MSRVSLFILFADYLAAHQRTFDQMRRRITDLFHFDPDDPFAWVIISVLLIALLILTADVAVWFLF
ncbi:MAG: hypothetical protein JST90_14300 [Bacteroidetes bacterium]|nr:hypothetical protein [Bacteroidota bacterium]